MARARTLGGWVLVLAPVLFLLSLVPMAFLLGSLGMDVHWRSRVLAYISIGSLAALLIASTHFGVWMIRGSKREQND